MHSHVPLVALVVALVLLFLLVAWLSFFWARRPVGLKGVKQNGSTVEKTRAPPPRGVATDWNRYQGKWYEQARTPSWFERPTLKNTTAEYTLVPPSSGGDGSPTVRVFNRGVDAVTGRVTAVEGTGRITDTPGTLGVSFFTGQAPSPYIVMSNDCGPNGEAPYQCATVGSRDRSNLWFLSRNPKTWTPERERYSRAVALANGYTPDTLAKLETVTHDAA